MRATPSPAGWILARITLVLVLTQPVQGVAQYAREVFDATSKHLRLGVIGYGGGE